MEFVYIASNISFKNMVKIGRTRNLEKRLKELNQIVPTPWEYVKTYTVTNSLYIEKFIHEALSGCRVNQDREFFRTDNIDIAATLDELVADAEHLQFKRKFKSVSKVQSSTDITELIKEVRLAKNITQGELARLTDVSVATIARIETGSETSLPTLIKLLNSLDCELRIGVGVDRNQARRRARKIYVTGK